MKLRRLALVTAAVLCASTAMAQAKRAPVPSAASVASAAPSASAAASPAPAAPKPAPPPKPAIPEADRPAVARMQATVDQIAALRAGTLDLAVDPASLFGAPLDDPRAVAIERRRLEAVLKQAREASDGAGGGGGAGGADGGAPPAKADDPLWTARLALDEARFGFLSLTPKSRGELLKKHQERQKAASDQALRVSEARRAAREAEDQRKAALEAARKARSEVLRSIAEEKARLLGVQARHADLEADLLRSGQSLKKLDENAVRWSRKVKATIQRATDGEIESREVDKTYDALVVALAQSRDDLQTALRRFTDGSSDVPHPGEDRLAALGPDVDTAEVDELRSKVLDSTAKLRALEAGHIAKRAKRLVKAVEELNHSRLDLLPFLSSDKSDGLAAFNALGRAQAQNEMRQLRLVLRYHFAASVRFVRDFSWAKQTRSDQISLTWKILKWLTVLVLFLGWRRRADGLLVEWRDRAREQEPPDDRVLRFIHFLRRVRRPAEWLILFWVADRLMPSTIAEQFEVRLIGTTLAWVLGEALVVNAMDAFLTQRAGHLRRQTQQAALRLRSLHLLGRVIVTAGLTLSITSLFVGEGTVHTWVVRLALLATVPVSLVLVQWWKPVIFQRIGRRPSHTPFTGWVNTNRTGWASFPAATAGGAYLLWRGGSRAVRDYLSGFDAFRRLLAYWFRREVAKSEGDEDDHVVALRPLEGEHLHMLDPEHEVTELVESVADPQVERVIECIDKPGGGVFAVVGERGAGKTALMARLEEATKSILVECPAGGVTGFLVVLREALGLPPDADDDALREAINARPDDSALLVDEAHLLVRPVIGGLDEFDKLLALARESSKACTWVFALDSIIWNFFTRARPAVPMFDEVITLRPWSEAGIRRLLENRSELAELDPTFHRLIRDLPESADDIERAEALRRAETNYYRLLWDYADGNPALALHFWRASLRLDDEDRCVVRLFMAPDTADLERLPDPAVFVLRAVLQLEYASVTDVVRATMLRPDAVDDAIRYGSARGYLEKCDEHYRIHWHWFRAISDFLVRRHLLIRKGRAL